MKKSFSFLILLSFLLASCGNKSDKEIQKSIDSGVVLIQNSSYYELVFPDGGGSIYSSGLDEKGKIQGLSTSGDSIKTIYSYGTGFFVSDDGKIATTLNVVSLKEATAEEEISPQKIFDAIRQYYSVLYYGAKGEYDRWSNLAQIANYSSSYSKEEYYEYKELRDAAKVEIEEYTHIYNLLNRYKASDCEIKYHNDLGIAYNNTYVATEKEFIPAVILKTDEAHNLALIELKDKKTPQDKYVFKVPEEDPLSKYSTMENLTKKIKEDKNSKLFLSGFNIGNTLVITKEGLNTQFNSGEITKEKDDRILYSIPAFEGSSGSPVVNLKGQLVAINVAEVGELDVFNYGIPVKYLKTLLEQ